MFPSNVLEYQKGACTRFIFSHIKDKLSVISRENTLDVEINGLPQVLCVSEMLSAKNASHNGVNVHSYGLIKHGEGKEMLPILEQTSASQPEHIRDFLITPLEDFNVYKNCWTLREGGRKLHETKKNSHSCLQQLFHESLSSLHNAR